AKDDIELSLATVVLHELASRPRRRDRINCGLRIADCRLKGRRRSPAAGSSSNPQSANRNPQTEGFFCPSEKARSLTGVNEATRTRPWGPGERNGRLRVK